MSRRHITEIIDEILVVVPADQTEFVAELDLLSQHVTQLGAVLAWEELGNICERYMGPKPTDKWHYSVASVIYRQPVSVIMERCNV